MATFAAHAHLHAAGTVVSSRALVALGSSGAGKSSLALAWSLAGYPLLGDDAVLLAADGRVYLTERVDLTRVGLDMKATVEQFREQVQNLE